MLGKITAISSVASLLVSTAQAASSDFNPGSFFQSKTVIIPHDDKKFRGGEDSADNDDTVLVVADGVGGWALRGINPGLFSGALTNHAVKFHKVHPEAHAADIAAVGCNSATEEFQGSATVCAVKLIENMRLQGANLGDSGYALFHVLPDNTL